MLDEPIALLIGTAPQLYDTYARLAQLAVLSLIENNAVVSRVRDT